MRRNKHGDCIAAFKYISNEAQCLKQFLKVIRKQMACWLSVMSVWLHIWQLEAFIWFQVLLDSRVSKISYLQVSVKKHQVYTQSSKKISCGAIAHVKWSFISWLETYILFTASKLLYRCLAPVLGTNSLKGSINTAIVC